MEMSKGNGVSAENEINILLAAAEKGDAAAQFHLGVCYEDGLGVAKNTANAAYWYEKAVAQGNQDAKDALKKYFGY